MLKNTILQLLDHKQEMGTKLKLLFKTYFCEMLKALSVARYVWCIWTWGSLLFMSVHVEELSAICDPYTNTHKIEK